MSRLQSIENSLRSINETLFQELCDSFLAIRNKNYSMLSRVGTKSGKQKTIVGTPDSFLLLPNGRYLFVEHSTNVTKGIKKLKSDVEKCLDSSKTGIPTNEISEIILCTNFNLKSNEVSELTKLLSETGIILTIYTLDSLSLELHLHHRDLVHYYLKLPLDTGQIVSIEMFVREYDQAANGIATPLSNQFVHREDELEELKSSISKFDFIILTGPPGVGKTRLSIESIKSFLVNHIDFNAYCISYKSYALLDDLYLYLRSDGDYILFVDDANRIDAFNQIIGFYKAARTGKLKVIITVRDYAYGEISSVCNQFAPVTIDLKKFEDSKIVDIIKAEPFEILNSDYQEVILRIADGNPRLAIMMALLARAKQRITALNDVSELFEKYFTTFISDNTEFSKNLNIKILGVISFFYAMPYKDRNIAETVLSYFSIGYEDFIDTIEQLDRLELVEVQFEYVKIPEQNLATYFFYRTFIKDSLLDFQVLLTHFFENNAKRFRDCLIPATYTFGPDKVLNKVKPELLMFWTRIRPNRQQAFKFLNIFWYYLQLETIEFLNSELKAIPLSTQEEYPVTYEGNAFLHNKDDIIELAGGFLSNNLFVKEVLELVFDYARRSSKRLPEVIHKIREVLVFDYPDQGLGFSRQNTLFDLIIDGVNKKDVFFTTIFLELAKTFLSFSFRLTKAGRGHTIRLYDYLLPNHTRIHNFRARLWDTLNNIFPFHRMKAFTVLENYSIPTPRTVNAIMQFDRTNILGIINNHLSANSFEDCRFVQNQIVRWRRNELDASGLDELSHRFVNPLYKMFLIIDWDRVRDKEIHDFNNHNEYEKMKEAEVRSSFHFNVYEDITSFYNDFVFLRKRAANNWHYNGSLEFVIDEVFRKNFAFGLNFLETIVNSNNEIRYVPRLVFHNHLKTEKSANAIWAVIDGKYFTDKAQWELSFFYQLDYNLVNQDYASGILKWISNIQEPITIYFTNLKKFLAIRPDLFQKMLKVIVEINRTAKHKVCIWLDFFSENFEHLEGDIALIKEAYLQQVALQDHFDIQGKGLQKILSADKSFLLMFVEDLYARFEDRYISSREMDLGFVWHVDGIEAEVEKVFDFVIHRDKFFIPADHFCNSFFKGLNPDHENKVEGFLATYIQANFKDVNKMNLIVDIANHSLKRLFEKILLLYVGLNQDAEDFTRISWRSSVGFYSGDVIIGDLQAAEWRHILGIVDKADLGLKMIPIKKAISDAIEGSLRFADMERKQRFLERD